MSLLVAPAEWSPPHPDAADLADRGPVIALVDMADKTSLTATRAAGELAAVAHRGQPAALKGRDVRGRETDGCKRVDRR